MKDLCVGFLDLRAIACRAIQLGSGLCNVVGLAICGGSVLNPESKVRDVYLRDIYIYILLEIVPRVHPRGQRKEKSYLFHVAS